MVAYDPRVSDLFVAEGEVVVGKADGARVVRALGMLQRAAEEGDGARGLAARGRQTRVEPPEVGQERRGEPFAQFIGRFAERLRGPGQVVLLQPGLSQTAAEYGQFAPRQPGIACGPLKQIGGVRPLTPLEGRKSLRQQRMPFNRGDRHGGQYTAYTGRGGYVSRGFWRRASGFRENQCSSDESAAGMTP